MARTPRFLSNIQAVEDRGKGKRPMTSAATAPPSAKKSRAQTSTPAAPASSVPPASSSAITIPAPPSSSGVAAASQPSGSAPLRAAPVRVAYGKAWEFGLTTEIDQACLPPPRLHDGNPISESDLRDVQRILHGGLQLVGLGQVFLTLKHKHALAVDQLQSVKVERSQLLSDMEALRAENTRLQEERNKMKEELKPVQAALSKAEGDLVLMTNARDQAAAEREVAMMGREEAESALASSKAEVEELASSLVGTAEEAFQSALEQLQHLNPSVTLNTEGYHFRSYFEDDGRFNAFVPVAKEVPTSAPEEGGGAAGEEEPSNLG